MIRSTKRTSSKSSIC